VKDLAPVVGEDELHEPIAEAANPIVEEKVPGSS